jgi:hypothetical protein
MVKYVILIQLFIFTHVYCQEIEYIFPLRCERALIIKNHKFGFINTKGQLVIPPIYSSAYSFSEGMAPVSKNGEFYGFINKEGKLVIKEKYNFVGHFSEGLALVYKNQKTGFIDKSGKYVIKPDYYGLSLYSFSEGLTPIVAPKGTLIDIGDKKVAGYKNYKYGYIDKQENWIIKPTFYEAKPFSSGFAAVKLKENGKWGYIDKTGKFIIKPRFDFLNPPSFKENMLRVRFPNSKYGFLNDKGEFAIKPVFSSAEDFSQALAVVSIGGEWCFINKKGEYVIETNFERTVSFNEGLAAVKLKENGKWGYIGLDGKIKIPCRYNYAESFSEGLAPVKYKGKWFFINPKGEIVTEIIIDKNKSSEVQ